MSARRLLLGVAILVGAVALAILWSDRPHSSQFADGDVHVLRVVGLFPMTGPGASLGTYLQRGAQLATEEIEERYGGRVRVDLEVLDSQNQPREAITALRARIARGRVDALIVGLSSVSRAVVPIVEAEGITTIATTTALTDLPVGTQHVVRVYPTSQDFVEPIAEHMLANFDRIGILYINDDFGESNRVVFERMAREAGKRIAAAEAFDLAQTDARSLIQRLLAGGARPEAVLVTGYGPAYVSMFQQLREGRPDLPIFTEIGFANPEVLSAVGRTAEGIIFNGTDLELSEPITDRARNFKNTYTQRFQTDPYQVAGFAFDAVLLLVDAAMVDGEFAVPTKADIISLSPFEGAMGEIRFDQEGESRIPLRLMTREGGATILFDREGS